MKPKILIKDRKWRQEKLAKKIPVRFPNQVNLSSSQVKKKGFVTTEIFTQLYILNFKLWLLNTRNLSYQSYYMQGMNTAKMIEILL